MTSWRTAVNHSFFSRGDLQSESEAGMWLTWQMWPAKLSSYVPTLLMWRTNEWTFLCSYIWMQGYESQKLYDIWMQSISTPYLHLHIVYKMIHLKPLMSNVTICVHCELDSRLEMRNRPFHISNVLETLFSNTQHEFQVLGTNCTLTIWLHSHW